MRQVCLLMLKEENAKQLTRKILRILTPEKEKFKKKKDDTYLGKFLLS